MSKVQIEIPDDRWFSGEWHQTVGQAVVRGNT